MIFRADDVVYAQESDEEVYDFLLAEFGEAAADTMVYTYVFRIGTLQPFETCIALMDKANGAKNHARAGSSRSGPPSIMERPASAASRVSVEEVHTPVEETELVRLVKNLQRGNQQVVR